MSEKGNPFAPPPPPASALGRHRIFSPRAGIKVSPLWLGAMSIGQAWDGMMGSMSKEDSFKLLDRFVELGGNAIDTANNYQEGESETWIGEWMAERKIRDSMMVATKFTTLYKGLDNRQFQSNYMGNHKKSLRLSLRDSLKKLKTDYVDLLWVHWLAHDTSVEEMMQSLNDVVKQGQVLYIGASDMPAWLVAKANQYARDHGLCQFVAYQGRWSLLQRDFEREILGMVRSEGMALCPWGAMGGGKFQSRKDVEERKSKGESLRAMMGDGSQTEDEIKVSEALTKVAAEHNIESVTAVALAYVMQKPYTPYVFPLVGGRKVSHLESNIKALEIALTPKQVAYLESVVPFDIGFPLNFVNADPAHGGQPSFLVAMAGEFDYVPGSQPILPKEKKDGAAAAQE